jgi:hypothetical protein
LLDWSGFLINSHDPLRGHVLKHIRQNSLASLCYSVADEGKEVVRKECIKINDFLESRTSALDPKQTKLWE